jgi:hypothetical protein
MSTGASNQYERIERARAMVRTAGAGFTNAGGAGLVAPATGINGVQRTGAGVYTMTLAQGMPSASTNLQPTIYGAAQGEISVEHTSDTVKTVRTFNAAGAAADFDFDLVVSQFAP